MSHFLASRPDSGHTVLATGAQPPPNSTELNPTDMQQWEQTLTFDPTPQNIDAIKNLLAIYRHKILSLSTFKPRPRPDPLGTLLDAAAYIDGNTYCQVMIRSRITHREIARQQTSAEHERLLDRRGRLIEVMGFTNQPARFREMMVDVIEHFRTT